MLKNGEYFVLLTDIFDSRKIEVRKTFEKKLLKELEWVAANYHRMFVIPIKQWKGIDEVAAVISDPSNIYEVIKHINEHIFPEKMRFVLAKGKVDLKKNSRDINLLDGEAFHLAANLMMDLKKEGLMFKSDSGNSRDDLAFSNQVNLVSIMKNTWTEKQMNIYSLYCATESQQTVADKLKITQQSVSKTLTAINAVKVMELEKKITDWTTAYYIK